MPFPPSHARSRGDVPQKHPTIPPARRDAQTVPRARAIPHLPRVSTGVLFQQRPLSRVPQRERPVSSARDDVFARVREPHREHGVTARVRTDEHARAVEREDDVIDRTALECDVAMTVCICIPTAFGIRRR